jgi:hypothetical protein
MFSTVSCHFFAFCQTLYARFTTLPRATIMLIIIKFMRYFPPHSQCLPLPTKQCWRFTFSTTIFLLFHKHTKCSSPPHLFSSSLTLHHHRTHKVETIQLNNCFQMIPVFFYATFCYIFIII